jgi:energy-coupling factor transporter ATP-binding protein EcfA2
MNMLDHALAYAKRGWKVFPLHTPSSEGKCSCRRDCGRDNGKHPRTLKGLKDATDNAVEIARLWNLWPDANIGILTGRESGIFVVDVDPRHGGTDTLKALLEQHGPLAEKFYATTGGGGWHIFFNHPGVYVKSRSGALGAGVDIKGEGGYVVAAPSLHASGNRYLWFAEYEFAKPISDAPRWLLSLLSTPEPQPAFAKEGEAIADGGRNQTLTSMAGAMRRRGMSEEAMYAALVVENENRCRPPLEEAEVRKISHSVSRYEPEAPIFTYPETVALDGERPEGIYFVPDFADRVRALYDRGMPGGVTTGIARLDYHYTVKLGQFTVLTGIPGHGKSALLDALLHNLAHTHGWRFAITSIENQPLERHAAQLLSIYMGKPFGKGPMARMSQAEMEEGLAWLEEHFVFILPNEGGCTVAGILDCIDWVDSTDFTVQGIVIDPWNELEHKRPAFRRFVSESVGGPEWSNSSLTRCVAALVNRGPSTFIRSTKNKRSISDALHPHKTTRGLSENRPRKSIC